MLHVHVGYERRVYHNLIITEFVIFCCTRTTICCGVLCCFTTVRLGRPDGVFRRRRRPVAAEWRRVSRLRMRALGISRHLYSRSLLHRLDSEYHRRQLV